MNVMNSNNIDNRLQPKRDFSSKKSAIKMGQERPSVVTLKTADREGGKGSIGKAQVDVVGNTKVGSGKGAEEKKIKRKRKSPLVPWKKPEGMPKRPLSAYNLFFQDRRKSIMLLASESSDSSLLKDSKGKSSKKKSGVGFANLARTIGTEWRALPADEKAPYESLAASDKERYDREMKVWRAKEKERKTMLESDSKPNPQSIEWSTLSSLTSGRKGFGGDLQLMRNLATDPSLQVSDMIAGMGAGGHSAGMLQMQDHDARGAFHSSIFSNNPYSMDASSEQASSMILQQQQRQRQLEDLRSYQSASFNMTDKRQLPPFTAMVKDNLEQRSSARENLLYDVGAMSASSSPQGTQASQFQNNPFHASRGMNNVAKSMPWSSQRNALNMENAMSTSIDLEPVPLPDNPHHQHQNANLAEKTRESQMGWAGLLGLQQMKDQQQQRTTIASDDQFLRRLSTGGAQMFSEGWGQSNAWNTNTLDKNEEMGITFGGRNVIQQTTEKNLLMSSQQIGNSPLEETKSGNIDTRSFPSSSTNPNQDLYRYYDDGAN